MVTGSDRVYDVFMMPNDIAEFLLALYWSYHTHSLSVMLTLTIMFTLKFSHQLCLFMYFPDIFWNIMILRLLAECVKNSQHHIL